MKKLLPILIILLSLILFVGCQDTSKNNTNTTTSKETATDDTNDFDTKIIGKWQTTEGNYTNYLTFNEDGTYSENITQLLNDQDVTFTVEGNWSVKGDELTWPASTIDGQKEDDLEKIGDIELTDEQKENFSFYFSDEPCEINLPQNRLVIINTARGGKIITYTKMEE